MVCWRFHLICPLSKLRKSLCSKTLCSFKPPFVLKTFENTLQILETDVISPASAGFLWHRAYRSDLRITVNEEELSLLFSLERTLNSQNWINHSNDTLIIHPHMDGLLLITVMLQHQWIYHKSQNLDKKTTLNPDAHPLPIPFMWFPQRGVGSTLNSIPINSLLSSFYIKVCTFWF